VKAEKEAAEKVEGAKEGGEAKKEGGEAKKEGGEKKEGADFVPPELAGGAAPAK